MNNSTFSNAKLNIRPIKFRDLEAISHLLETNYLEEINGSENSLSKLYQQIKRFQSCYGLLPLVQLFPPAINNSFVVFVAEQNDNFLGLIQVSPNNKNRTTWRVEQVLINPHNTSNQLLIGSKNIGSQLLRYSFEKIWEARTWVLEVNINEKETLGLYRQNGFQPLAQMTSWCCPPSILQELAEKEPDLPNLLPISNSDAKLLYQLDCVSLPPLLRQVFDRHIEDFKTGLITYITEKIKQKLNNQEVISGYVFEPQRKAAIGYFKLKISLDGSHSHQAKLTVHPAYTWLYPKLLRQMAVIIQRVPPQSLQLSSGDYQPEREEYLEKLGAQRIEHNLLMSRSVWHKLKESKPLEALKLPEVLQGLQPARNPIPTPWLKSMLKDYNQSLLNHDQSNCSKSKKSSLENDKEE